MKRTKRLSLDVISLIDHLPNKPSTRSLSKQICDSATSVAANYRIACRAKSKRDMLNKFKIVEEEADETLFWLELLEESHLLKSEQVASLKKETNEIISIMVASIKTLRKSIDHDSNRKS